MGESCESRLRCRGGEVHVNVGIVILWAIPSPNPWRKRSLYVFPMWLPSGQMIIDGYHLMTPFV